MMHFVYLCFLHDLLVLTIVFLFYLLFIITFIYLFLHSDNNMIKLVWPLISGPMALVLRHDIILKLPHLCTSSFAV